jgi:uncharacterized repeat protein (TIGR01451 family)
VQLEPSQAGDYTTSAKAVGSTADPSPEDAAATKSLHVAAGPPSADLSVSVESSPTPAAVPDGFTQTISVTNDGPTEATDVFATVLLPQGASATQPIPPETDVLALISGSCPYGFGFSSSAVVCFDAVRPGETRSATLEIAPSIHSPPTLRTDAVVSAYTRDSNLANNRASNETAVSPFTPSPGLDFRLAFDEPPTLTAGKQVVVPFHLSNLGLRDAGQVTVRATTSPAVPSLALSLQIGNGGVDCAPASGEATVECQVPELPSDNRLRGYLYAPPTEAGTYSATVTVTSPELSAPMAATSTFEVKPSRARR